MSEQKPRAWLQEPKVQPIAGRHFVRGVRTVEPTADEYEFAALDGDVLLPLYDAAALAAAVAAERERCATALRLAREGYAAEEATGLPVLPQWRARVVAMLDDAIRSAP